MAAPVMRTDSLDVPAYRKEAERRNRMIRDMAASAKCDFALRYLDVREATGKPDTDIAPFQVKVLNETGMFASMLKSRQIGASFILAGDGLCDGMIKGRHTIICTSFNLEESKEKIVYAKQWWESRVSDPWNVPTDSEFDERGHWIGEQGDRVKRYPELVRATGYHMEFSNGFRFFSYPGKPPRGKSASFIGDEFAIVMNASEIYRAAFPMITRGRGLCTVRLASTPMGAAGQFYEIHTNEGGKYPNFVRWDFGWWEIFELCPPELFRECEAAFHSGMDFQEMIDRFGTDFFRDSIANFDEDSVHQEYFLQFLDSLYSFLSIELIKSCYPPVSLDIDGYIEDEDPDEVERWLDGAYVGFVAVATGAARGSVDEQVAKCFAAVEDLRRAVESGDVTENLVFTYDCGRTRDGAEITIFERTGREFKQRLMLTMRNIPFAYQRAVIKAVYEDLPVRRGMLDRNGIGRDLWEWANGRWGEWKAAGTDFTNDEKNEWATTLKKDMEQRRVKLIPDRDQERQLHSIQRKSTALSGKFQFVVAENQTNLGGGKTVAHHADKFWTVAMGVWLCEEMDRTTSPPATMQTEQGTIAQNVTEQSSRRGFRPVTGASKPSLAQQIKRKMSRE